MLLDGKDERSRTNEVRSHGLEHQAFPVRRQPQAEGTLVPVLKATVHQTVRRRHAAAGQVAPVDQNGGEASYRGFPGDAAPREAAANHQQVDWLGRQILYRHAP